MTIRITATDAGFHSLSGLGQPIAPDLFLNGFLDTTGTAAPLPGARDWRIEIPGGWVTLSNDTPVAQGDDMVMEVAFSSLTYGRTAAGQQLTGGEIVLEQAITLTVIFDAEGWADTAWVDSAGDALAAVVRQEGIHFAGAAGRDILDLSDHPYPIYGPVVLRGRGGDDVLSGGRMDTRISGGAGDDVLSDAGGTSVLRGGRGADTITLGVWSEGSRAFGGGGDDTLRSSNGADRLVGGAGSDTLEGGRGSDVIIGGRGSDTLNGGAGADRFVFSTKHAGSDTVEDFSLAEDRIVLRATGEDVRVEQDGADTVLNWDMGAVRILNTDADAFDWI